MGIPPYRPLRKLGFQFTQTRLYMCQLGIRISLEKFQLPTLFNVFGQTIGLVIKAILLDVYIRSNCFLSTFRQEI